MSADLSAEHGESPTGTITYYESWDFSFLVACVSGKYSFPDMFRLWEKRGKSGDTVANPEAAGGVTLDAATDVAGNEPAWEFMVYDSPLWDEINQNIFRQYRAAIVTDPARLAKLPPVPPVPDIEPPSRESYYLSDTPPHAADFPRFCAELTQRGADEATLTVTLKEDAYESSNGDGKFLYFSDAVLPAADAPQAEIAGEERYEPVATEGWYRYYRRSLPVRRVGDAIEFPRFKLAVFDHYRPVEALEKAEAHLAGDESKDQNGSESKQE